MKEVAEVAGVSVTTVSRYFNDPDSVKSATRSKVAEVVQEMGFAPNRIARNFRTGSTGIIVVVVSGIGDPFFTDVMEGINRVASELSYMILIKEADAHPVAKDELTNFILSKQSDGIILLGARSPFSDSLKNSRVIPPIVICCEAVVPGLESLPAVRIDNLAAGKDATKHLLQLGHQKIACIGGQEGSILTREREMGFREAMKEAGLKVNEAWVAPGSLSIEGGRKATRRILKMGGKPTAIFCTNDEMALGAYAEIAAAGLRIPDDISIMGYDNTRYAEVMTPPLTTIAQPAQEIGEHGLYLLCSLIQGQQITNPLEIVSHKLVVRDSTAPLRG